MNKHFWILSFWVIMFIGSSCVPLREIRYFNDMKEFKDPIPNPRIQKKIAPFDNLYIKVLSTDEKTAQIFNSTETMRYNISTNMISYLVDEKGSINFPFAGDINIGGLTTTEAGEKIQKALSEYIANTAVVVKYIDNKVSVLGEVQRQGVYNFNEDKISVYQALSLAGGMTRFGDHKNVIIIRQEENKISHYKINLSNSKIIRDDLYYILPNDILIIEPLKAVSWSYQNMTYATILSTITTIVAVLYFTKL